MNFKNKNTFWILIAGAIGLLGLGIIKLLSSSGAYEGWLLIGIGILAGAVSLSFRKKNKLERKKV
jgi:hypothetical protein